MKSPSKEVPIFDCKTNMRLQTSAGLDRR